MPEPTAARLPSYQARLLERTAHAHSPSFALSRTGSLVSRSSSASSSTATTSTANTNMASTGAFGQTGKSWSGGSLSDEREMEEGKRVDSRAPTAPGKRASVSSVKGMWEQRIQELGSDHPASPAAAASAILSPARSLGRAGSISVRQQAFGAGTGAPEGTGTTPRDVKRRTMPATFSGASGAGYNFTTPPASTPTAMGSTPAPAISASTTPPNRVRRTISFDTPPARGPIPTLNPTSASPSRTPLSRALTDQTPSSAPASEDAKAKPQFRSAYMASKHAHSLSLSSTPTGTDDTLHGHRITPPADTPPAPAPAASTIPTARPPEPKPAAAVIGLGLGRRVARRLERIASGDGPDPDSQEHEKENKDPAPPSALSFPTSSRNAGERERPESPTKGVNLHGRGLGGGGLSRAGSVRMAVRDRERADSLARTGSVSTGSTAGGRPPSPLKQAFLPREPERPTEREREREREMGKEKEPSPTLPVFTKLWEREGKGSPTLPIFPSTPKRDAALSDYAYDVHAHVHTPASPIRQTQMATAQIPPTTPRRPALSPTKERDAARVPPPSPTKARDPPSTPTPRTPRLRHQTSRDVLPLSLPISSAPVPLLPAPPTQDELQLRQDEGEEGEVQVHGIPGRIRLSRNLPALSAPGSPVRPEAASFSSSAAAAALTPTHKSTPSIPVLPGIGISSTGATPKTSRWALWADRNREGIAAYEYLCRVGEAKAWIESAMGRELDLSIPEFEEGLRDGVVLARLVKQWGAQGKVFEHRKLQWRHSDNVNIFLEYVRGVGQPENFIFEFTDLYEKKNMPKVIYCIHALSHLLARRGIAQRIGSLLGTLEFSDDQLAATQKGLTEAGVAMPNFGNVGRELWKEMREEVVEEVETEEEARDRELLEAEDSIVLFQTFARGFMARRRCAEKLSRLDRLAPSITALQALGRGCLARRTIAQRRRAAQLVEGTFVVGLQAQARGVLVRARWTRRVRELEKSSTVRVFQGLQARARGILARRRVREVTKSLEAVGSSVVWTQSVLRGVLVRKRIRDFLTRLDAQEASVVVLQAAARGALARRRRKAHEEQQAVPQVLRSVVSLQARARGLLRRRRAEEMAKQIGAVVPCMVGLQAQARGALVRERIRVRLAVLDGHEDAVLGFQAAARGYLARRQYGEMMKSLRRATPVFVGLQARARAMLARKAAKDLEKALAEVQVVHAVSSLQAFARAALTRKRHHEQAKQLAFVAPDVLGLQAQCRGVLARRAFGWWWHYLHGHQSEATHLQALCRGIIVRRRFVQKMNYYRANLSKVVKIQSLFRAKEQREQYQQLTMGKNVTVSTIKNFVHLLNDSEFDFGDEIEVERLRKKVVEGIRENQQLETYVTELDVKIALVVQNVKSFEELINARRWGVNGAGAHTSRAAVLAAHGDPFAGPNTLDIATKRKLELYQQLFYLLQTKGEYLGRLFFRMSRVEMPEKTKRIVERVTLTLFGYGQRREEYLMLKLFQHAIQEEVRAAPTISDVVESHPMFLSISLQYVRPKQVTWIRDALHTLIEEVIGQPAFNLETDPVMIYRAVINAEEMRSGVSSGKPIDVTFEEAAFDHHTRGEWIRHLQMLRHYTEQFLNAITESTRKMPYSIRCIAREMLASVKTKFPGQSDEVYAAAVGKFMYYRYMHPAIVAPDTFDIVPDTVGAAARRNLAEVARMLSQISSGVPFLEDVPSLLPLNAFITAGIAQMQKWFLEVADMPNPEEQFNAHEFLDAAEQPRSIIISPNEVYAVHSLLAQNLDHLVTSHDDTLRVIIVELDGVPHLGTDELREARDRPVTLDLTNRFSDVKDPNAGEKALWVHAKRGVLAVLRVQPGKDLMESLMSPVLDEHETIWQDLVAQEFPTEQVRNRKLRLPTMTASDSAYRLEDIRTQTYRDIKAQAMFYLLELEKLGKLTRGDGFQGILNAIAGDVRSKHMKRMQRKNELESMEEALKHLAERKKAFEEQINSYHSYIDSAMNTMQRGKGKKRFVMPFTRQYFHLRDLQKAGKNPQFGSYKYSAQELYDKGILLSVDKFSPRQFDRISLVISSDQVGEFTVEMFNNSYGTSAVMGSTTLRMEDLLQSQFENRVSLSLFDGLAKVNLNLLLYQINKKFYV